MNHNLIYTLFLFILFANSSILQAQSDSLEAKALIDKGDQMFDEGQYSQAAEQFHKASKIYENKSSKWYVKSLSRSTDALRLAGKYDSALTLADKTLKLVQHAANLHPKTIVNAYIDKAMLLEDMGEYDMAEIFYDSTSIKHTALIEKPDYLLFYINIQKGGFYFNRGLMIKSKDHLLKSLEVALDVGLDSVDVARCYNNISLVYASLGNQYKAIEYAEKGLVFYGNDRSAAHAHINMAYAYSELGKYREAISSLKDGLVNRLRNYPATHFLLGACYFELSNVYSYHLDYDTGLYYIDKALNIFEKEPVSKSRMASVYVIKAKALSRKAVSEKNLSYADMSDDNLYQASSLIAKGNNPTIFNEINLIRADNELTRGNDQMALDIIEEAMNIMCPNISNYSNPKLNDFCFSKIDLIKLLDYRLNVLLKHFNQNDKSDQKSVLMIKNAFQTLDSHIDFFLNNIYTRDSKGQVLVKYQKTYGATYQFFFQNNLYKDALMVSQTAKAKQLRYAVKITRQISDPLVDEEKNVELQITRLKSQMMSIEKTTEPSEEFLQLQDSVLKLERIHSEILIQINDLFFSQVEYNLSTSGLREVSREEVVVDYYLTSDKIYISEIRSDKLQISEVGTVREIEILIDIMNDKREGSINEAAYELKNKLLPFVKNDYSVDHITIVPDGVLWNVNFELLLTSQSDLKDPRRLPYLINQFALGYAYTALNSDGNKRKLEETKGILAFSYSENNPSLNERGSFEILRSDDRELPGSLAELRAIANVLNGDYLTGEAASEREFKDKAHQYQILHMAVHGEVDDLKPENSRLYFYAKGDSLEDGFLHIFELYNLSLQADLAVLSACETGTGEIQKGEGVMSLGRAFAYAGVNSLLLTRKKISDAIPEGIMSVFYRELKEGKRKSEALRQAKLQFLATANTISANPKYWSGFYIIGDDSPIEFKEYNTIWKYLLIVSILAIGSMIFVYRKKR